jgi:hypothetical protein
VEIILILAAGCQGASGAALGLHLVPSILDEDILTLACEA